MKITLLTYGSRGDVQPFLALAVGLQKAGHTVTLAGPHRFADFVARYNVPFVPLAGDPEEISRIINDAGDNVYRMVKGMQEYIFGIAPDVVRETLAAINGAELLVHGFLFTTGAHSFAKEMGISDISLQIFPMFAPTRAFPNVALANLPLGSLSYFSHWIATQVFWYGGNSGYKQLRGRVPANLPEKLYWPFTPTPGRTLTPLLFAYSPTVLPRPDDWTSPNIHIPGYLFLDEAEEYHPPVALSEFLDAGDPPVCISFGSMVNRDAERIHQSVREALKLTRQRSIFLSGWGNYHNDRNGDNILYIDSAPHDWLFPRCKAIIHHGGAGTTAAGLRSGKPNIVVPHSADQPFWGKRVAAIGAGPEPIPVKSITSQRLVTALDSADESVLQARAQEVGRLIQRENGVEEAVRIIESLLQP